MCVCVCVCVCACVCVCGCMQEMPFPATQHNTTQGRGFARRTLNCAAMAIAWSVSEWLVQCLALSSHQPREIKPKQTPKQNTRNACFNSGAGRCGGLRTKKEHTNVGGLEVCFVPNKNRMDSVCLFSVFVCLGSKGGRKEKKKKEGKKSKG